MEQCTRRKFQSGDVASFASSGKFTIAFIGSSEHTAHFANIEYSGFANIDVAHPNVVMTDDGSEAFDRLLFSIGKGLASGLQDALNIEELRDTVLGFMASYGISIVVGAVIDPPLIIAIIGVLAAVVSVISASFMVAQAIEGIYDTATSTGTVYQKAEAYAYDAVLLIMSVGAIIGAAKEVLNSIKTLRSVLEQLKGRKTRFQPEEVLENRPTDGDISAKEIECIFSYDDFMNCVGNYLDADALKYLNANLNGSNEDISFLRKIAKASWKSRQNIGDTKLNKTDIAFGLDKLMQSGSVDDAVETMVRCSKAKLNRYGNLYEVLEQQGITLDQFDELKLSNVDEMGAHEIKMMRAIRESIPNPTNETCLRKTIPISEVDNYKGENGWNTIRGYVARDGDVSHIEGYKNVRESLRLDYVEKDGKIPYPENGNAYGYIKFYTNDTGLLEIPYGKMFQGGTNTDGAPCTRNGFLGSENGEIIPEWRFQGMVSPKDGAELHRVINGDDKIIAKYRKGHFIEEPIQ